MHRAHKISSSFNEEVDEIRAKYNNAEFPKPYVESVIKQFNDKKSTEQDKPVTENQKENEKAFIPIKIPFCDKNEKMARNFLKKLNSFTNSKFKFSIVWQTKKIRSLFRLKDVTKMQACVIYEGISDHDENTRYIGETKLISDIRWNQHNDPKHESSPAKYLRQHPTHKFKWKVLCKSSSNTTKRKIHEALFIARYKPNLNNQVLHKKLVLFRNGIT